MLCYRCNREIPDNALVCSWCGAEMSVKSRNNNGGFGVPFGMAQPMNWYKFVIYFVLFFEAIESFPTGIFYITGIMSRLTFGDEYMLSTFYDLGGYYYIADIAYGIFCVAVAVFAIITRFEMAKFKKRSLKLYMIYLIVPAVVNIIYTACLYIAMDAGSESYASLVMSAIPQSVYVYLNYIYFSKRKTLFNN